METTTREQRYLLELLLICSFSCKPRVCGIFIMPPRSIPVRCCGLSFLLAAAAIFKVFTLIQTHVTASKAVLLEYANFILDHILIVKSWSNVMFFFMFYVDEFF